MPGFPPPPPPPLPPPLPPPPPHPIAPTTAHRGSIPNIASQFRRLLGTMKSAATASVVPPVGQISCFMSFSALEAAVVVTVSVEVWAAVPLMVTLAGFKLHEGMSLTLVNDVVTTQLRFTAPENPFVPTMLIIPVFPVVAPGVIDMEVVPPLPTVKPGCGVIDREILVVALSVPEVPVTVTVTGAEVT